MDLQTIDIEDFAFNKTGSEVKESMKASLGDILADPVCDRLEEDNLFNWFDVAHQNKSSITELDSTIGTKDLEIDELLNIGPLYKVLAESDTANWDDPVKFSAVLFSTLAEVVDSEFESDEAYIEYIKQNDDLSPEEEADLELKYEEMQNSEQDSIIDLISDDSQFELEFANMYGRVATLLSTGLIENWDSIPEVGDYIVYTVEKNSSEKTGDIVLKVTGIETDTLTVSDIAEDVSAEEDIVLETIESIVVENVASDDTVLELYENHYLLQDINESNTLTAEDEDIMTVYDENPLPL